MITIVQTHAYKVTKDRKYIDRAAKEMVMYLDELQRPNGLFYHAPDVPFYWGRGNGWMAAGMSELLRCLPKKHKDRARILEGYQKMMKSLKEYQNADGLWNQLIDKSDCWTESSGSAMFTFAFIMGVKNGWLDAEEYAPAARKAWLALVPYVNEKNQVREVCVGTNKRMICSTIMIVLVVLVIIMDKVPFFGVLSLFWKNNRVFPYSCFIAA